MLQLFSTNHSLVKCTKPPLDAEKVLVNAF